MIEWLKEIMATKNKTKPSPAVVTKESATVGEKVASSNVIALEGAEYVTPIQPNSVSDLRQKYAIDKQTLLERVEQELKQIAAFEGAIAACDQILQAHTTKDKVEIDG